MKHFIKQILQDKNGCFSLREFLIAVLILIIVVSWVAQQFFGKNIPEFMFYSFISLIAAGCFGYSLERKSFEPSSNQKEN
jgi:choline-glycine betaine transporter